MNLRLSQIFSITIQLVVVLIVISLLSCGTSQPSTDYQHALSIYQETVDLEIEVRAIKRSLEQVIAQDPAMAVYATRLDSITTELDRWENDVANMEEVNDELLGHSHPEKDGLSDQQTLQLQTELRERMGQISDRIENLMLKMSN